MAWIKWTSSKAVKPTPIKGCLGLELTASRARAATGVPTRGRTHPLEEPHLDLPLTISLERRTPQIGRAGGELIRRLPHLVCHNFLPYLGQPQSWRGGRHILDSTKALTIFLDKIRGASPLFEHFFFGLPEYLTSSQIARLTAIALKHRFPLKGTASNALALVVDHADLLSVKAPAKSKGTGVHPKSHKPSQPTEVLVVDADDHALILNVVSVEPGEAIVKGTSTRPRLGVGLWKEKLLDTFADRCVHFCRRDPRDSGDAEQSLFEQIDESLDHIRTGKHVDLTVRAAHWYQDLHLQPADFESACLPLIRSSVEAVRELLEVTATTLPLRAVWLTHEAGRLPGLARAVHHHLAERTSISVLRPEAVASAVANLGDRFLAGELPNTHLDQSIAIPGTINLEPPAESRTPEAMKFMKG